MRDNGGWVWNALVYAISRATYNRSFFFRGNRRYLLKPFVTGCEEKNKKTVSTPCPSLSPDNMPSAFTDEELEREREHEREGILAPTALMRAARAGDAARVRSLLAAPGATKEVDARNFWGMCALHHAAASDNGEVVELLAAAGAALDAEDVDAWTPLAHAAHFGALSAARALLERGAAAGSANKNGVAPADVAEAVGCRELAALLREAAASAAAARRR